MISIFDGNIYYTSNDSDKALSAILKKRDEHDPAYTWIGETDFIPYSDEYLYSLIPDEVNEELGMGIFPSFLKENLIWNLLGSLLSDSIPKKMLQKHGNGCKKKE